MDKLGATLDELPEQPERVLRFPQVQEAPELFRILALPRRPAPTANDPKTAELAAQLTRRLAKVSNPSPGALRPLQAAALMEAWQSGGAGLFLKVGGGKQLTAFLLPTVLGAKQPLYVAPGNLRAETLANFAKYRKDWHGGELEFLSCEELSNPSGGEELDDSGTVVRHNALERRQPDLLLFDEADALGKVATSRVRSYLRRRPRTKVVVLTGSPFKTSIYPAARMLEWALGAKSPLPRPSVGWEELQAWCDYLDVRQSSGVSTGVGALMRFLTEAEADSFYATGDLQERKQMVRRAIARHVYETAGVLSSQGDGKLVADDGREVGLEIRALMPGAECPATNEFFEAVRAGQLPDGTVLADPLAKSRHAYTAGFNYFTKFNPEPPQAWRDARNAWSSWCAAAIQRNRRGIDSEARMVRAVRKHLFNDEGRLAEWEAAQRRYKAETGLDEPPSEAVWLSDQAVDAAEAWVSEHGGLVWTVGTELGQRIAERCGIPYYRERGRDAKKRHIKDHPGGAAVCSFASNRRGRNLQSIWSKQLFLATPEEQSLARVHREGQQHDCVVWVFVGCYEHLRAFERAKEDKAAFAESMLLATSKLGLADGHMPSVEELADRSGPRWSR